MRYKECLDYIRSDYYRITGKKDVGLFRMWATTILEEGFRFLFWFRLSNCDNTLLSGVSRIFYRIIGSNLRISIQRSTKIGYGLNSSWRSCCYQRIGYNWG